MKIVDIVRQYEKCGGQPDSYRSYEQLLPELFDHYFRYWSDRSAPFCQTNQQTLERRRNMILKEMPAIAEQFESFGLHLDDLTVVLFVGVGTSNGHAYRHDSRLTVWLPVETYSSESLVRVFVAHELAHACHYASRPEFYFESEAELLHFGRLLMTEGLATFASEIIMGLTTREALWGDYLEEKAADAWIHACEACRSELARYAKESFDRVDRREFFQIADSNDIYRNRAGYYVGVQALAKLSDTHDLSLTDLLHMSRADLSRLILATLQEMSED